MAGYWDCGARFLPVRAALPVPGLCFYRSAGKGYNPALTPVAIRLMPRLVTLFNVEPLMTELSSGQLILTPNQRLASRIINAYSIAMDRAGQRVVEKPCVLSLTHWIDQLWYELESAAVVEAIEVSVLNTDQQLALWNDVIERSPAGQLLLRPQAAAKQAMTAYRDLQLWQLDVSQSGLREQFLANMDSATLLEWMEAFESRCSALRQITETGRVSIILGAFQRGELTAPAFATLVGFDDIAPLYQALLNAVGKQRFYQTHNKAATAHAVRCESASQELQAAAVWSKHILKDNPQATVAVVVPDLTARRAEVTGVFLKVFEPEFAAPFKDRRNLPFNISAGYPLAQVPVIRAAFDALSLLGKTVELGNLVRILQSPFYRCIDGDFDAVSRLIARLYRERRHLIKTARLRQLAELERSEDHAVWIAELQQLAELSRRQLPLRQSLRSWLKVFEEALDILGWPGNRQLDSSEFQAVSHWLQLKERALKLDAVSQPQSFSMAVTALQRLATESSFQIQTADSSLQILGLLEAAGLEYTHLWLCGMSDQQWPAQPSPNPLIPFHLQRQLNMPNASAERELIYARRLSERFLHSCDQLVVSYPVLVEEKPAQLSRLWAELTEQGVDQVLPRPLQHLYPVFELRLRHLESAKMVLAANDALELQPDETVAGGVSLFANQAACPFRAFARHRLKVTGFDQPSLALTAAERGELLHRSLELIWKKLKTRQALLELEDSAFDQLVESCAQYSLNELSQRHSDLGRCYLTIEKQRLIDLLTAWLKLEKTRTDFIVVDTEARKTFRYAGLELTTRIDRIDRLSDDRIAIIDYKSGTPHRRRWWGERPDEPQLPLYSVLAEQDGESVAAVAFAQINVAEVGFKSAGDEDCAEPLFQWDKKLAAESGAGDWSQLRQQWQQTLSALANDFIQGRAVVDPKSPPETCRYCDLATVCRIHHEERH